MKQSTVLSRMGALVALRSDWYKSGRILDAVRHRRRGRKCPAESLEALEYIDLYKVRRKLPPPAATKRWMRFLCGGGEGRPCLKALYFWTTTSCEWSASQIWIKFKPAGAVVIVSYPH